MSRRYTPDPYAGKKIVWTRRMELRLVALRKAETPWSEISQLLEISMAACAFRYGMLTRGEQKPKKLKARESFNDSNIVETARQLLRLHGYSQRQIDQMPLDTLMRTANEILAAAGQRQLGRKAEWLIDTPAETR